MKNSILLKKAIKKGLKVGYVDGEMSPHLSWNYGYWDVNIKYDQIEVPTQITSVSFMLEGDKKPTTLGWDCDVGKFSDSPIASGIWMQKDKDRELLEYTVNALNGVDILIGQNHRAFDLKEFQWRLNVLDLPPLENLICIDTLKMSRKVFRPPSHKLDAKSIQYGRGGKIKQDMQDCIAVAKGDDKRQKVRMVYNAKDVTDTRYMFWKELDYYFLPKAITNMLLKFIKDEKPFCVNCKERRQKRFEVKAVKDRWECLNCEHTWVKI